MTRRPVDRLSIRRRPTGLPLMRQWWGKLLFMHWPVAAASLRPLVAPHLSIDTYEGQAWVGVVPFTMWGVRAYFGPPVPGLSSFHELNVRTYVHHDGVPGVWFLSMDINNSVARWGGRQFYFLPYYDAEMSLSQQGQKIVYSSRRTEPDSLDFFLTERYCLYSSYKEQLYRCRVFHQPWPLRRAEVSAHHSTLLEALGLPAPTGDPLLHYAEALKVDIWPLRRVAKVARASALEAAKA